MGVADKCLNLTKQVLGKKKHFASPNKIKSQDWHNSYSNDGEMAL